VPAGDARSVGSTARGTSVSAAQGNATFSIVAPLGGEARSFQLAVDGGAPRTIDMAGSRRECTPGSESVQCTLAESLAQGSHTFDFATYSGPHGSATHLSSSTKIPFELDARGVTIGIALVGAPAALTLVAPRDENVVARTDGVYEIYGNKPLIFQAFAKDAQGRLILGKAAPGIALSGRGLTVRPVHGDANSFVVTSKAKSPDVVTSVLTARIAGSQVTAATLNVELSQPWIYVARDGKVAAFDAQGRRQATPGGFGNLLFPASIAYDSKNRSLYVLDVVTQKVHAYDLTGHERILRDGFAGFTDGVAIAYDLHVGALCVTQGERMEQRCFDGAGQSIRSAAGMTADSETHGRLEIPSSLRDADALTIVKR